MKGRLHDRLVTAAMRVVRNAERRGIVTEHEALEELGRFGMWLVESWHRLDPVRAETVADEMLGEERE